ncbi:hypothetical protein F2Q69_00017687 [Brassica cretica]|uniref:Uncharacterized protein n=1 Tax=Brassica cretica TaxID=69181 RepID=A0A8S9QSN1_BRACR|nr:hypothetical protein F2Q69_00017687 [Brassica cretica]
MVPCALTALDHWSPQVKGQGRNIASDDEMWIHVVELSVLLVTKLHPNNPETVQVL